LACLAAGLAAGCIRSDSKLVLHADGSVDVVHRGAVSEEAMRKFMRDLLSQPDYQPEPVFDAKAIGAALERVKELGVEVKTFKVESKDGWQSIHLEARCRDLLSAGYLAKAADMDIKYVLARNADGSYTLREEQNRPFNPSALLAAKTDEKARKEALEKVKGLRAVTTFTVPGEIKATTATEREGRTARWVLDASAPDFLEKAAAALAKPTSVTFAAKGLELKEVGRHRYIRQHTDVELKSEGQVIVAEKKSMHLQMIEEMHGLGRALGSKVRLADAWFDAEKLRPSMRQRLPKGAKLLEVKCGQEKSWKHSLVRVAYPDLGAARQGALNRTATLKKNADGSYVLALQSGDEFTARHLEGTAGKLMIAQHLKLCSHIRASYAAKVPGELVRTNAHESKGGVPRWAYVPGDAQLEAKVRKQISEGMKVTFKGEGLKLKEFPKPASGMVPIFGFREGGGRVTASREITVDRSRFSKIYPAVWFSPSTGEITALKAKSEEPPEKKYEIWIEPNDPEFAFVKGAGKEAGFVLLGYGEDAFRGSEVPRAPKPNKRLHHLVKEEDVKRKPVFYCRARSSTCLIMLTVMDKKAERIVFKWKLFERD
jgi:hypothetical protein